MKGYYGCYYDWGNFFKYENITLDDLLETLHDGTVYDTISIVREMKEARKAELDDMLMKPENAANMKLVNEYTDIQAELEKLEEEYFSLEE